MRVDVCSDLHLEFGDLELPGGDILIISGDACEARYLDKSAYGLDTVHFAFEDPRRKKSRFYRFFEEECKKYRKTILVMGNHEHYGGRFDKTYDQIRDNLPAHVQLMEKETVDIRREALQMSWYMRGGITYNQALSLSVNERMLISELIKEHLETTKKSGLPFF
jgi:3',5'-cyclic AMP phosphodiesterase CpdA